MELLIWAGRLCLKIMYGIYQMEIQKDYIMVISAQPIIQVEVIPQTTRQIISRN